ncbi:unnamed protein product, partial [Ilex paraguariensis]
THEKQLQRVRAEAAEIHQKSSSNTIRESSWDPAESQLIQSSRWNRGKKQKNS